MSHFLKKQKIREMLGTEELLCQLSEECVELAMEVDRLYEYKQGGWTVGEFELGSREETEKFLKHGIEEEIADVQLVANLAMSAIGISNCDVDYINKIADVELSHRRELPVNKTLKVTHNKCLEISKNCMKLRRAITTKNPTPIPFEEARMDIIYNVSLLYGMMHFLEQFFGFKDILMIEKNKTDRWYERLLEMQGSDVNEQE